MLHDYISKLHSDKYSIDLGVLQALIKYFHIYLPMERLSIEEVKERGRKKAYNYACRNASGALSESTKLKYTQPSEDKLNKWAIIYIGDSLMSMTHMKGRFY